MNKVVVIGGAGHVGLPFSIVIANSGKYDVVGIDLNLQACKDLNNGNMPYIERGGDEALDKALASKRLKFTIDARHEELDSADVVCIMIGTPVDSENNPRLDDLFDYFEYTLIPSLLRTKNEKLVLLRSTVNPGTTRLLRERLKAELSEERFDMVHLIFAPERVAQGCGIEETPKLPQLIGLDTYSNQEPSLRAWKLTQEFFGAFVKPPCIKLSPEEAELGKLMTNMARYVSFALANEFYMIADQFSYKEDGRSIDINKVIDAINHEYPRLNLPKPGPNVGGPCLFKDGRFLTAQIPFGDLINTAFLINEGFVNYIFEKVYRLATTQYSIPKTVAILGMTFKKDNDDIRNSLSFRMAKVAKQKGLNVVMCDPLWKTDDARNIDFHEAVDQADIVILMTPHKVLVEMLEEKMTREYTPGTYDYKWFVDIWRALDTKDTDGISYPYFYTGKKPTP